MPVELFIDGVTGKRECGDRAIKNPASSHAKPMGFWVVFMFGTDIS